MHRLPKDCEFRSFHCASSRITDQQLVCVSPAHLRLIDFCFPENDSVTVRGLAHLFGPLVEACEIRWSNPKLLSVLGRGLRSSLHMHTLCFWYHPVTDEDVKAWDLKADPFPRMRHLAIDTLEPNEYSDLSSMSLSALTSAFPLLQTLRLKLHTITAESFVGLTRLPALRELELCMHRDSPRITDQLIRAWQPADRARLRKLVLWHAQVSWNTVLYLASSGVLERLDLYLVMEEEEDCDHEDTPGPGKAESKCSLQELRLSSCNESPFVLKRLPELGASLRRLHLYDWFDDDTQTQVCQYIAQLHRLHTVQLLRLTDPCIAKLSQLSELEVLQADSGGFSSKSFPCFGETGMPKLKSVFLRYAHLTQTETSTQ